jgi:hypothetical protein
MTSLSRKLETRIRCGATECYLPVFAASDTEKRGVAERCERHGEVPRITSKCAERVILPYGVQLQYEHDAIDHWSEIGCAFGSKGWSL